MSVSWCLWELRCDRALKDLSRESRKNVVSNMYSCVKMLMPLFEFHVLKNDLVIVEVICTNTLW